jgi:hypothetical protein
MGCAKKFMVKGKQIQLNNNPFVAKRKEEFIFLSGKQWQVFISDR